MTALNILGYVDLYLDYSLIPVVLLGIIGAYGMGKTEPFTNARKIFGGCFVLACLLLCIGMVMIGGVVIYSLIV